MQQSPQSRLTDPAGLCRDTARSGRCTLISFMTARKGVSAMQLSKEIGCQYRTAWHMLHCVREACAAISS